MYNQTQLKNDKKINTILSELPWYVEEFIDHKRRKLSLISLLNYCHDYKIFFQWLVSDGVIDTKVKDISLEQLQSLKVRQVEAFLRYLKYQLDNKEITVNRKLSALKSLFHYLQNVAETVDLKPYIQRNVMAKVELNELKDSIETIANKMEGKILMGDEYDQFRLFISKNYGQLNQDNKKRYRFYLQNRERDTALISLILGSGLRLSEIVNLNIHDIDFYKYSARVIRKGNREQFVYFSKQAAEDLQTYITIRELRYDIDRKNKALFVSSHMGPKETSRRLSPRAIEKLIEKYALAFGKPMLSVHKLRHSFATRYHSEINDVPKLRRQLGHSSIQTTMIYTHINNDDLKTAVDKMDIRR